MSHPALEGRHADMLDTFLTPGRWRGSVPAMTTTQQAETMAAELAAADRDGILLWLTTTGAKPATRVGVAARILTASVYQQAALLGIVDCAHCGDHGCQVCRLGVGIDLTTRDPR